MLGRYSGNFQSDPEEIKPFIADKLMDMASWSICAFGYREFDVMIAAIENGGHCRVGFENNLHLKDGKLAPTSADLVRQLADACQPATREQTLELFFETIQRNRCIIRHNEYTKCFPTIRRINI